MNTHTETITVDGETVHMDKFGSFGEMLAYCNTNPQFGMSEHGTREFTMTDSFAEAYELARSGWHDVRPEVQTMLDALTDRLAERLDMAHTTQYGVAGAIVDMGRYMQGDPECMMEFVTEPQARMGKVVRVFVDYGASGSFSAEFIRKRGIVLLALVDTLGRLGVSCELWGETAVRGGGKTHTTVTKLHDATEQMDIDTLMFALAHPSMLRRMAFCVREMSSVANAIGAKQGGGYGSTVHTKYAQVYGADVRMERLESYASKCMTDPVEWVMQTITGLGLVE
jgi:hypothetical protein